MNGKNRFILLIYGHYNEKDVVDYLGKLFSGNGIQSRHINGDKLYGRGSTDMESGLAASAIAMIE